MDESANNLTQEGLAHRFSALWKAEGPSPDVFLFLKEHPRSKPSELGQVCLIDQHQRWRTGCGLTVETYLEKLPGVAADEALKLMLVVGEFRCLYQNGRKPDFDNFVSRFPDLRDLLFLNLKASDRPGTDGNKFGPTVTFNSDAQGEDGFWRVNLQNGAFEEPRSSRGHPKSIGRYSIKRILGDGGYGRVFLAHDDVLNRPVAIKVPHRERITSPQDIDGYLTEARVVASLDHPGIVPVYDVGHTDDGLCFVVSKFIEGSDLAIKCKRSHFTNTAAAELVAIVADALHYAHLRGVVHRDIKPANILIDTNERPYIADFGIALKDEDFGKDLPTMGTPAYMSPEQARGEGHLVDGRSDIFSLGIVFYQLLTGRAPFQRSLKNRANLIEPRPPRQVDDAIPMELERICLKALSNRVAERYNTASDMAEDLRYFMGLGEERSTRKQIVSSLSAPLVESTSGHLSMLSEITIVPKGLRSFDRDDAGFFLALLPGPRDREGLPESVRFWKTRIDQTDPDMTFRVGLIYGPSGCGKSSLLKAGVIPRLDEQVTTIYVESTAADTETRLLKALRKRCPDLPPVYSLSETMTALRRGGGTGTGKKTLIVLDQFEQWLHSRPEAENSELIRAIRQCDGDHIQCVVSVRDDFWMAVTRFMDDLDVTLVPGENVLAVDLFSLRHARKILSAIGRAHGSLPEGSQEVTAGQKSFVNKAVVDLARNDKVIPVHLALFAEMVKDKPWNPSTLRDVGGSEGVGVTFLEETFNGRTANPNHRLHQQAARSVLKSLLSEESGNIKGGMRSYQELIEVSGYKNRPKDFDALLHMLDSELRLITPTDPEGNDTQDELTLSLPKEKRKCFHLTHDYLVPSLRDWLTRKQKETRRGRAELLLAERAYVWNSRRKSRSLPSIREWLNILLFCSRRVRTSRKDYRLFLQAAMRFHVSRFLVAVLLISLIVWWGSERNGSARARALVESLKSARTQDVPAIIVEIEPFRKWADSLLFELQNSSTISSRECLHSAMALLPVDRAQENYLYESLLTSEPRGFAAIRDVLAIYGDNAAIGKRLWEELADERKNADRRFRAGLSLVTFDSDEDGRFSNRWQQSTGFLAEHLVSDVNKNPAHFVLWVEALRPVRHQLGSGLEQIFTNTNLLDSDRNKAAVILAEYVADDPIKLAQLLLKATPRQYAILLPNLHRHTETARSFLISVFNADLPSEVKPEQQREFAKRRAHAAVLLLELNYPEPLWSALTATSDPDFYTYTEDRLSRVAAGPELLYRKLLKHPNSTLRAAILRSFGGMPRKKLPNELQTRLFSTVKHLFRSDPDAGVHSSSEWALKTWGEYQRVEKPKMNVSNKIALTDRGWYTSPMGHTMVVFKGPIESRTGSPADEQGRDASDESFSTRRINRDFAISTKEITSEQFLEIFPNFRHQENEYTPSSDCPVVALTWHRAALYCLLLSKQEGIPENQWCYHRSDRNSAMMIPTSDYLSRTGYRLPTEAEWEYACRAGTTTSFSWGNDPRMIGRYACYLGNSDGSHWPVGSLCPNRFGLFDMHGNVAEWIQETYLEVLPEKADDVEDRAAYEDDSNRTIRGGSVVEFVPYQRVANRRYSKAYSGSSFQKGFRVARTLRVEK